MLMGLYEQMTGSPGVQVVRSAPPPHLGRTGALTERSMTEEDFGDSADPYFFERDDRHVTPLEMHVGVRRGEIPLSAYVGHRPMGSPITKPPATATEEDLRVQESLAQGRFRPPLIQDPTDASYAYVDRYDGSYDVYRNGVQTGTARRGSHAARSIASVVAGGQALPVRRGPSAMDILQSKRFTEHDAFRSDDPRSAPFRGELTSQYETEALRNKS